MHVDISYFGCSLLIIRFPDQGVVRSQLPKIAKRQFTIGTNSESVIQQLVPSACTSSACAVQLETDLCADQS